MKNIQFYKIPTKEGQISRWLKIVANSEKLLNLTFEKSLLASDEQIRESSLLRESKQQLDQYFKGQRKKFDLPYEIAGSDFQRQVLKLIADIPYGKTLSYQEIAQKINNPKACRAVGLVCRNNRLPIIIPCHRVIKKSGGLGGYAGGVRLKEFLLNLERDG